MFKFFKRTFNRLVMTLILLLIQIALITWVLNEAADYYALVNFIFIGISLVFAFLVLSKKDMPFSTKVPIFILLIAFPIAGIFLYYFSIQNRMRRKIVKNIKNQTFTLESLYVENKDIKEELYALDKDIYNQSQFIEGHTYLPVYANNTTKFFENGETFFSELIEDLKKAKHFIFLEFFIISRRFIVE